MQDDLNKKATVRYDLGPWINRLSDRNTVIRKAELVWIRSVCDHLRCCSRMLHTSAFSHFYIYRWTSLAQWYKSPQVRTGTSWSYKPIWYVPYKRSQTCTAVMAVGALCSPLTKGVSWSKIGKIGFRFLAGLSLPTNLPCRRELLVFSKAIMPD